METFQTSIVKSKVLNRRDPLYILFAAIYIIATLFVFIPSVFGFDRQAEPFWLKISTLLVYLIGLVFILQKSFYKPIKVGEIFLDSDHIRIKLNNSLTDISIKEVKKLTLDYFGTAGILTTFYGNNNYLLIQFADSREEKEYEILIKTNNDKKQLKRIIESFKGQDINVEVNIIGSHGLKYF